MTQDEKTKQAFIDFEKTGRPPMHLVKAICQLFDYARGKWEEKYMGKDHVDAKHLDKIMRWALLKTVAYLVKINKKGLATILKGSPSPSALKWRIAKFAMQMISQNWEAYKHRDGKEIDKWLEKRMARHEAKPAAQWVDNALR